jgi:AraC-like DNA-binding protein
MTGFKSAAHFSRMFKSAYSASPKEYRAKHASLQTEVGAGRESQPGRSANVGAEAKRVLG